MHILRSTSLENGLHVSVRSNMPSLVVDAVVVDDMMRPGMHSLVLNTLVYCEWQCSKRCGNFLMDVILNPKPYSSFHFLFHYPHSTPIQP